MASSTRTILLRPARELDAAALAPHVRESDRFELWAGWRKEPLRALEDSLRASSQSFALLIEDSEIPVALAGVAPVTALTRDAAPWLIASDRIEEIPSAFVRASRRIVDEWLLDFRSLENVVHAGNETSIKWLKWLGAEFDEPEALGPERVLFRRFRLRRD